MDSILWHKVWVNFDGTLAVLSERELYVKKKQQQNKLVFSLAMHASDPSGFNSSGGDDPSAQKSFLTEEYEARRKKSKGERYAKAFRIFSWLSTISLTKGGTLFLSEIAEYGIKKFISNEHCR